MIGAYVTKIFTNVKIFHSYKKLCFLFINNDNAVILTVNLLVNVLHDFTFVMMFDTFVMIFDTFVMMFDRFVMMLDRSGVCLTHLVLSLTDLV